MKVIVEQQGVDLPPKDNFDLPEHFPSRIRAIYGADGEKWLEDLPQIVAGLAAKWSLTTEKSYPNLSYHFVAPCVRADGLKAVLKIGVPVESSPFYNEQKILRIFEGAGAVKLLQFDETICALLLERLLPGATLKEIYPADDDNATEIAIKVMRRIWREPPTQHDFPAVENWIDNMRQKLLGTIFAPEEVRKAFRYFEELRRVSKKNMLLHGDLHHENILAAEREPFLAIDPQGVIGDIGYEISVFLNNPRERILSQSNPRAFLSGRVEKFAAAFEIEPPNLRKWAFVQGILSAWWSFEDNETGWEDSVAFAEIWETNEI